MINEYCALIGSDLNDRGWSCSMLESHPWKIDSLCDPVKTQSWLCFITHHFIILRYSSDYLTLHCSFFKVVPSMTVQIVVICIVLNIKIEGTVSWWFGIFLTLCPCNEKHFCIPAVFLSFLTWNNWKRIGLNAIVQFWKAKYMQRKPNNRVNDKLNLTTI